MSQELTTQFAELKTLVLQSIQLQTKLQKTSQLENSLFSKELSKHYLALATELAKSSMIPKHYIGKPMDIFIAMAMGYQLGMPVEQALQDIAVINGKPCMYGDGLLAVVMSHPDFEDIIEEPMLQGETIVGYKCTIKRKGKADYTTCFTLTMAKKAGLLGKPGPWSQYEARMLQMRARGFAVRDRFPDALRGIKSREEIEDYIELDKANYSVTEAKPESRTEILKMREALKTREEKKDDPITSNPTDVSDATASGMAETSTDSRHHSEPMAQAGRAESVLPHNPASDEQLDLICDLMREKQFSEDRLKKALDYYKADSVALLDEESAADFIQRLYKEKVNHD